MKKLFALLTVCSIFQGIYGQILNYPLSSYKTPDYKFQSLEFNFNTDGGTKNNNYSTEDVDNTYNNSLGFSGNLNAHYYLYNYTRNKQTSYSGGVYTGQSFINNNNKNNTSSNFQSNESLSFRYRQNRYFTDKFFYGYSSSASVDYNGSVNKQTSDVVQLDVEKRTSNSFRVNLSAGFNIGVGRIENISSATNAMFLLKDLQQNGFVTGDIDNDKITKLADRIAVLRQSRFFDSRLNRMKQIEEVDSLLRGQNIVTDNSASYFANLIDQWDYIKLNNNYSGKSLVYSIVPSVSLLSQKYKEDGVISFEKELMPSVSLSQSLMYRNSMPLNLYWSREYMASIGVNCIYLNDKNTNNDKVDFLSTVSSINAVLNYSYTPNTRTYFSFGTSISSNHTMYSYDYDDREKSDNVLDVIGDMHGNAEYYLSPQLSVSGNINLSYKYQDTDSETDYYDITYMTDVTNWRKSNQFNLDYSISLVYKFM